MAAVPDERSIIGCREHVSGNLAAIIDIARPAVGHRKIGPKIDELTIFPEEREHRPGFAVPPSAHDTTRVVDGCRLAPVPTRGNTEFQHLVPPPKRRAVERSVGRDPADDVAEVVHAPRASVDVSWWADQGLESESLRPPEPLVRLTAARVVIPDDVARLIEIGRERGPRAHDALGPVDHGRDLVLALPMHGRAHAAYSGNDRQSHADSGSKAHGSLPARGEDGVACA